MILEDKMGNYLRTDILEEGIRSLEFICERLDLVLEDTYQWKWIIIGTDNALQNFMVAALRDSVGYNILDAKIRKKWWNAFLKEKMRPEEKLDGFLNLYSGIQSSQMNNYFGSKPFIPNQVQDSSIKKLHELRNKFIHFIPKGWSLEVSGLPDIITRCIEIIDYLVNESGNILFYEEMHDNRYHLVVKKIKGKINNMMELYKTNEMTPSMANMGVGNID
jgi:hypothetical protein